MQLLATAEEMQTFDRTAISKLGIPGLILMENAGRAFVDELAKRITPLSGKQVVIVCGRGNNGGDGYVIARHLLNRDCNVTVALLCKRKDVYGESKTNLDMLFKQIPQRKNVLKIIEVGSTSRLNNLSRPDIIIDAIFGTGFKGKASGLYLKSIKWINGSNSFVAAVDMSSGVDATTGIVDGEAVRARLTVTMGLAKIGQFVGTGREHSGEVIVADISIPNTVMGKENVGTFRITIEDVRNALPKRSLTAHKYSVGKVFVIAGSRKFTGAPFMCAQAAMRAGAGAAILGVPKSIQPVLARKCTEVMIAPLDETSEGTLSQTSYQTILERSDWADVVAIGPGLSREPETLALIRKLISNIHKPLVIDADALFAVASDRSILAKRKHDTILTPHAGELSAITGENPKEIELHRVDAARIVAKKLRSIVCLKGAPTVTATPDSLTYLNSTGNPGMATIGSGDVLTGVIASLLAQGMNIEESAWAGVYIHGQAGDLAAAKLGERSVMAHDILDCIPAAFRMAEQR